MHQLPTALAPLAAYRQFILYMLVPSKRKPGKMDKLPVDWRTGRMPEKGGGGAHDPAIWTDAATAIAYAQQYGQSYGVGFVFTKDDPFWFLDIDNCLLPDGSAWSDLANQLCAVFPGAAIEVSSSGKGLHIIGSGVAPYHGSRNKTYGLEFYTELRFVALTGINATGDAGADFTPILPSLVAQFFPPGTDDQDRPADWTDGPDPEWRGPTDDAQLIERAMRSQSAAAAFGGKASFRDLWEANIAVLAKTYPPDGEGSASVYNESSADRALAQHLAFWTGKDCERISRLMWQSKLVRPKWDREDYLPRTIISAVGAQRDVLTDKEPEPLAFTADVVPNSQGEPPTAKMVTGSIYLGVPDQIQTMKGCVYIIDANRILAPGGALLKAEQFRVLYGGYQFMLDQGNDKTTRDAYEAFTQNFAYRCPRADSTCFRPALPPATLVKEAGRVRANTYWPIEVPRKVGDPTPFLIHLAKLLPDETDRIRLLSYMAAIVQHKGVKFQWAPFIQGVEGNGKTLFTRCVAEAVGKRYTHMPPAHEISEKFNAWLFNTIFIGVEDVFVPHQKQEIFEILKPMITSEDLAKRAMNTDQVMADVVCNFIFNSNHRAGLKKTRNDRRIGIFLTAQQTEADLIRDGMTGDYFPKLYDWLKNQNGYAIVSELLHTFPIEEQYNPANGHRAPTTTTTERAIEESRGAVEQEILEIIEHGNRPGFMGGWVSSTFLSKFLEETNNTRRVPINRRREVMESLGYIYHPALTDGRLNNSVLPDNCRPRLYVKKDSPLCHIASAHDVSDAYCKAQGLVVRGVM